jgi:hypothetical protein
VSRTDPEPTRAALREPPLRERLLGSDPERLRLYQTSAPFRRAVDAIVEADRVGHEPWGMAGYCLAFFARDLVRLTDEIVKRNLREPSPTIIATAHLRPLTACPSCGEPLA